MPADLDLPGLSSFREIGRGGYGVVYGAWQEKLRRTVAVKVLTTRLDERAMKRFEQECRALGMVSSHPNIVAVYEVGTLPTGEAYLVMGFCDGGSLADLVQAEGPLQWTEVLDIGVRLSGALQTAHDAGILHRDIKPANILLDAYGVPRLADFGQARHTDSDLTRTGEVAVTVGYAAPEVLHGKPAGPRADVYSLSAALAALMLGRGPFSGPTDENIAAMMYRVVTEPPPDLRAHGVPDPFCGLLERGMAKDLMERPGTALEFGELLQGVQRSMNIPATPLALAGRPASGALPAVRDTGPNSGPQGSVHAEQPGYGGQGAATLDSGRQPAWTTPELRAGIQPPAASRVQQPPAPGQYGPQRPSSGQFRSEEQPTTVGPALGHGAQLRAWTAVPPRQAFGASPPGHPPTSTPPMSGGPSRQKRRWWVPIGAAVLVVALAVGGFFLFQTLSPPQPIDVSDAGKLLLAPRDFEGDWQTMPDASSFATKVLGQYAMPTAPQPSGIATCLDLPFLDRADSQESGVYTTTSGIEGSYALVQTAGFVMKSEAAADGMVDPWRSPEFDQCFSEAGSYLDYNYGEEARDYEKDVQFFEPDLGIDLPETVNLTYRRLVFPLTMEADGTEGELDRYFDLIALSAGKSVVYLFVQTDDAELPTGVRDAAVQSLVSRLVE